jgi:hypothetical protein
VKKENDKWQEKEEGLKESGLVGISDGDSYAVGYAVHLWWGRNKKVDRRI